MESKLSLLVVLLRNGPSQSPLDVRKGSQTALRFAKVPRFLIFVRLLPQIVCLVEGLVDLCNRLPLLSFSHYLDGNISQGIFREPRRETTLSIHGGKGVKGH